MDTRGITVSGATDVLISRGWVHNTLSTGIDARIDFGPAKVTVADSLVDRTVRYGMYVDGAEVTVERTVIRNTLPRNQQLGRGINIRGAANVALRSVLVDHNCEIGLLVSGSEATVEDCVIRDTLERSTDQTGGQGIIIQPSDTGVGSVVALRRSFVERNREVGALFMGSEVTVDATVFRDTVGRASDNSLGRGVYIQQSVETGARAFVTIRSSLTEGIREVGVVVTGSEATFEAVVVRDTQPEASSQRFGHGVDVQHGDAGSMVTLRSSVIERNHMAGVLISSGATVEATVVRDTLAEVDSGMFGRGIQIQPPPSGAVVAPISVRFSRVERNHEIGVMVFERQASVEASVVRETLVRPLDGLFGDGIVVRADYGSASATLASSLFDSNARTGVVVFGAGGELSGSALKCNALDLIAEPWQGKAPNLVNRGGNICGCGEVEQTCKAVSTSLVPPEPLVEQPEDKP